MSDDRRSATNNPSSPTVRFNVGGTPFEVSRSLLSTNNNMLKTTALGRMISDMWQHDPDAIIFIDRDGENFRHVLQYLRYGRVTLPLSISKSAFLQDMDFFGIAIAPPGSVTDNDHIVDDSLANLQAARRLIALGQECHAKAGELMAERECIIVAYECFKEYVRTGSLSVTIKEKEINPMATNVCFRRDVQLFNKCLAKYGLCQVEAIKSFSFETNAYSHVTSTLREITVPMTSNGP
jgi:BTB/POZ domain